MTDEERREMMRKNWAAQMRGLGYHPDGNPKKEEKKGNRPDMLEKPLPIYEHEDSRIPDGIRVSFEDGTTAVYYLHTEQPAPLIFENIRIIRRMKQGYVNKPLRRRGRK